MDFVTTSEIWRWFPLQQNLYQHRYPSGFVDSGTLPVRGLSPALLSFACYENGATSQISASETRLHLVLISVGDLGGNTDPKFRKGTRRLRRA